MPSADVRAAGAWEFGHCVMKHSGFPFSAARSAPVPVSLASAEEQASPYDGMQPRRQSFEFQYENSHFSQAHAYLVPKIDRILRDLNPSSVFEIGAGNGSIARHLASRYKIVGIDPSRTGIEQSRRANPSVELVLGSGYDDLQARFGQFDCVLSVEVIEHLFEPRLFAKRMFELVAPGGTAIVTTPYHGYLKNLALAFTGRMDQHFTALWDGGHIKFWSVRTLRALLSEAGFRNIRFEFAGRIRPLAKSMIATAQRP